MRSLGFGLAAVLGSGLVLTYAPATEATRTQFRHSPASSNALQRAPVSTDLTADLDDIFADPVITRALVGVRVESLQTGAVLYERNGGKLVMPASNMKLVTMAVAAERLGWDYRYETRLEYTGTIDGGTLTGDLIVTGSGDPSIVAQDAGPAPVFGEWAEALLRAGIRRVNGRLIGNDNAFDDTGVGVGWEWDDLTAGYAAPSGALSYNENVVRIAVTPGRNAAEAARVDLMPAAGIFEIDNGVVTGAAGSTNRLDLIRLPFNTRLTVRGTVAAGGTPVIRTMAVDNPTRFFVEGLAAALAERGIAIRGGAWDVDDAPEPPGPEGRRLVARRESLPLSFLAGHFMKDSQNFYGEMLLKTIGRVASGVGSSSTGRQAVLETLAKWNVSPDAIVMRDGSGLSRQNYVTADAIVIILKRMWQDERMRGRFLPLLPVAGHDGTLEARMRGTVLNGRVQAKTGTISNVRSLSGFVHTRSGEQLVFSMIANHFTATSASIDAVVEKALLRLVEKQ